MRRACMWRVYAAGGPASNPLRLRTPKSPWSRREVFEAPSWDYWFDGVLVCLGCLFYWIDVGLSVVFRLLFDCPVGLWSCVGSSVDFVYVFGLVVGGLRFGLRALWLFYWLVLMFVWFFVFGLGCFAVVSLVWSWVDSLWVFGWFAVRLSGAFGLALAFYDCLALFSLWLFLRSFGFGFCGGLLSGFSRCVLVRDCFCGVWVIRSLIPFRVFGLSIGVFCLWSGP